jgi:hypothetical protein
MRATVRHAIEHGPNTLRKAVLQQFVVEVRIESGESSGRPSGFPLAGFVNCPGWWALLCSVRTASPTSKHFRSTLVA